MAAARNVTRQLTIALEAGNASPIELGKALGPIGVNPRSVKQEYDQHTADRRGDIIPVVVTVFEDRGFELRYKSPPTAFLIRRATGIVKGSGRAGHDGAGTITADELRWVAEQKLADLNTDDITVAVRIVAGTARSMGLVVKD
jgi:large subunit ribosomal protein L11